jgi:hypothetical protein
MGQPLFPFGCPQNQSPPVHARRAFRHLGPVKRPDNLRLGPIGGLCRNHVARTTFAAAMLSSSRTAIRRRNTQRPASRCFIRTGGRYCPVRIMRRRWRSCCTAGRSGFACSNYGLTGRRCRSRACQRLDRKWRDGRTTLRSDREDPGLDGELLGWDAGDDDQIPPPRGWLLGTSFCRGFASSLLGDGGVGKTALRYSRCCRSRPGVRSQANTSSSAAAS